MSLSSSVLSLPDISDLTLGDGLSSEAFSLSNLDFPGDLWLEIAEELEPADVHTLSLVRLSPLNSTESYRFSYDLDGQSIPGPALSVWVMGEDTEIGVSQARNLPTHIPSKHDEYCPTEESSAEAWKMAHAHLTSLRQMASCNVSLGWCRRTGDDHVNGSCAAHTWGQVLAHWARQGRWTSPCALGSWSSWRRRSKDPEGRGQVRVCRG